MDRLTLRTAALDPCQRHGQLPTVDPIIDVIDVIGLYQPNPAAAAARATYSNSGGVFGADD
jgi:hypothetical protein